jgi:Lrp/AsnC family transcriptional regulator for asnA, asnC and gidA
MHLLRKKRVSLKDVYKYLIYCEKCLYNLHLSGQTFKASYIRFSFEESHLRAILNGNIDKVDLEIVTLLQEDSRQSFNRIANRLGISVGTAYNRVKNLKATGVLKSYTILLDPVKLGYSLTAVILVQAEGEHLLEVENEIAKTANVVAVYDIMGDYDAAVVARFKDRVNLNAFIKNLLAIPHVKRTVTNVALNIIKEDYNVNLNEI